MANNLTMSEQKTLIAESHTPDGAACERIITIGAIFSMLDRLESMGYESAITALADDLMMALDPVSRAVLNADPAGYLRGEYNDGGEKAHLKDYLDGERMQSSVKV
jgi:hypothetical protein